MRFVEGKKNMNKQMKKALLVMLTSFSILPGCGKKSDQPVVAAAPAAAVSQIGSGQCATVSYNSPQTITFYGQLSQGYSGIVANLSAYGYGAQSFGGSNYYRNLSTGDAVNVYVSGTTAYATISMAANTVNAIVAGAGAYSGSAQVCGVAINESIFASPLSGSGYTGTMGGGTIALWGNYGWIVYPGGNPQTGQGAILF
jgi:hypothetical protein